MHFSFYFSGLFLLLATCAKIEKFEAIGQRVISPIDVVTNETGQYFYVLNTDPSRQFNQGTLLVLNDQGEKLATLDVPRLGRSASLAGSDLILTFDRSDEETSPSVWLVDISSPALPLVRKIFEIDCSPINAAIQKGYDYFFVTCRGGELYSGVLKSDRSLSELKIIRRYGYPRRAMYLDASRNLLLQFPTPPVVSSRKVSDEMRDDIKTYDTQGNESTEPNDIPDNMEDTTTGRINRAQRQRFQFTALDISKEAAAGFPERGPRDWTVEYEMRFVYFTLANFDGTPDPVGAGVDNLKAKYYRTGFWTAQQDPVNKDVFYLSQRGSADTSSAGTVTANHVVRVRFTGDILGDGAKKPLTGSVLSFDRVYGFKGELFDDGKLAYPGHFEVKEVQGQKLIVVNHFRDLANWPRSQSFFSIAAKILDNHTWVFEKSTQDGGSSFYQFALNKSGVAMVCGYYSDVVIMLDIRPGVDITELKRIH